MKKCERKRERECNNSRDGNRKIKKRDTRTERKAYRERQEEGNIGNRN